MKDLKIKVNSEAESKEAQELFFGLGASLGNGDEHAVLVPSIVGLAVIDDLINFVFNDVVFADIKQCEELTIPQLRDLVVLNRNDVGDATHSVDGESGSAIMLNGVWYGYNFHDGIWDLWVDDEEYKVRDLKPIEKPMKEYLRKNSNGTYSYIGTVRPEHVSDFMIEIPEGANYAYNNDQGLCFLSGSLGDNHPLLIWQRPSIPEELPFIDDEPEITTAKGSELDYIAKIHDMRDRYDGESDEDYCYQLEHYISRKEPSLNNQYAEIEKVRQSHRTASETADPTIKETLSQRQEQYGSFEDVAMITEQMVDIMRKGYYENLAYNQKMALYMICSKMARIVNGNPNHKDSWHDIAGYATLIDSELVSEKDMPF